MSILKVRALSYVQEALKNLEPVQQDEYERTVSKIKDMGSILRLSQYPRSEKLQNSRDLYAIDAGRAHRILYTTYTTRQTNEEYVILLSITPEHDYESALREIDQAAYFECVRNIESEIEMLPPPAMKAEYSPRIKYRKKQCKLTPSQLEVTEKNQVILLSPGGAGKTLSAIQWMGERACTQNLMYVTHTHKLIQDVEESFSESFPLQKESLKYFTMNKLISEMSAHFTEFEKYESKTESNFSSFESFISSERRLAIATSNSDLTRREKEAALDAVSVYSEFTQIIMTPSSVVAEAYLTESEYCALGENASYFKKENRSTLYGHFTAYLSFLEKNNYFEPGIRVFHLCEALSLLKHLNDESSHLFFETYAIDGFVADEIQNFYLAELRLLFLMMTNPKNGPYFISGDIHQSIEKIKQKIVRPIYVELEKMGIRAPLVSSLQISYRNSLAVAQLAQRILQLSNHWWGSSERDSVYDLSVPETAPQGYADVASLRLLDQLAGASKAETMVPARVKNAQTIISSDHVMVIVPDTLKDEDIPSSLKCENHFIFHISQIAGLESSHVIFYGFEDTGILNELNGWHKKNDLPPVAEKIRYHRKKEDSEKPSIEAKKLLNSLYTAATRSLYFLIVQKKDSDDSFFHTLIQEVGNTEKAQEQLIVEQKKMTHSDKLEKVLAYCDSGTEDGLVNAKKLLCNLLGESRCIDFLERKIDRKTAYHFFLNVFSEISKLSQSEKQSWIAILGNIFENKAHNDWADFLQKIELAIINHELARSFFRKHFPSQKNIAPKAIQKNETVEEVSAVSELSQKHLESRENEKEVMSTEAISFFSAASKKTLISIEEENTEKAIWDEIMNFFSLNQGIDFYKFVQRDYIAFLLTKDELGEKKEKDNFYKENHVNVLVEKLITTLSKKNKTQLVMFFDVMQKNVKAIVNEVIDSHSERLLKNKACDLYKQLLKNQYEEIERNIPEIEAAIYLALSDPNVLVESSTENFIKNRSERIAFFERADQCGYKNRLFSYVEMIFLCDPVIAIPSLGNFSFSEADLVRIKFLERAGNLPDGTGFLGSLKRYIIFAIEASYHYFVIKKMECMDRVSNVELLENINANYVRLKTALDDLSKGGFVCAYDRISRIFNVLTDVNIKINDHDAAAQSYLPSLRDSLSKIEILFSEFFSRPGVALKLSSTGVLFPVSPSFFEVHSFLFMLAEVNLMVTKLIYLFISPDFKEKSEKCFSEIKKTIEWIHAVSKNSEDIRNKIRDIYDRFTCASGFHKNIYDSLRKYKNITSFIDFLTMAIQKTSEPSSMTMFNHRDKKKPDKSSQLKPFSMK